MNKYCEQKFEPKMGAKVVSKTSGQFKQKLWTWIVNKIYQVAKKGVNKSFERNLWSKELMQSYEQKLWIIVVSISCEQRCEQELW